MPSDTEARAAARCPWATDPLAVVYHDEEWGVPVHEDRTHFEFLVLEGAQAGLSWLTILRKRDGYRRCFAEFDPAAVADFSEDDIERVLEDPGIVRNRQKVRATVSNAARFLELAEEAGSFDRYIWSFVGDTPIKNAFRSMSEVPARTAVSEALSADLRRRGFAFVGPTVCYAHLQAAGLVNDHLVTCPRWTALG